jgi:hypothetical protein
MENQPIQWDPEVEKKFHLMTSKIPLFHRQMAERVVKDAAEENARQRNSSLVQEGDVVRAFLSDVPRPFYSMMIKLFEVVGFSYRQYQNKT